MWGEEGDGREENVPPSSNPGYSTNINAPFISFPTPTAAHPVFGAENLTDKCSDRSFAWVVVLCDAASARHRSVFFSASTLQNCRAEDRVETKSSENSVVSNEVFIL
jgi:hypothetical protein